MRLNGSNRENVVLREVASFVGRHSLSGSLLLAVSGGVDSSVMMHAFHFLSGLPAGLPALSDRIGVAHVNFHLRGEDSNQDQEFVRNAALQFGFEFYTADFDTVAYAKEHKLSIEIAARELRYSWFLGLMIEKGFGCVLTAHNANDNAETLLLNLVRGTGRKGLCGIRPYAPLSSDLPQQAQPEASTMRVQLMQQNAPAGTSFFVGRPLLSVERSDIEKYAQEFGVAFRTDYTNSQDNYSRNKIRNQVLPLLSQINPSVVATLNKDIARFTELDAETDKLVQEKLEGIFWDGANMAAVQVSPRQASGKLSVVEQLRNKYLLASIDAQRLCIQENPGFWVCEMLRSCNIPFTEDDVEALSSALKQEKDSSSVLKHKKSSFTTLRFKLKEHIATLERGQLRLYGQGFMDKDYTAVEVPAPVVCKFGPFELDFSIAESQSLLGGLPGSKEVILSRYAATGCSVLDADTLNFPLQVRTMQEGDRFCPFGLKGSKSVADFLNSRKVDLLFKRIVPLVLDGRGIVCIPSVEVADRNKVTRHTKRILVVAVTLDALLQ